jgi:hypothetical protein
MSGSFFSRPWRDWLVLTYPTQHCVLGYSQPSLRDSMDRWSSHADSSARTLHDQLRVGSVGDRERWLSAASSRLVTKAKGSPTTLK